MEIRTVRQLIALNHRFYAQFGSQFSATRQRIQPGITKLLPRLSSTDIILDLGCGNGEFARALSRHGASGRYIGIDFSVPLLADARKQPGNLAVEFLEADLTGANWDQHFRANQFSIITAFAVLHHIPGHELRLEMLRKIKNLLAVHGQFIHSNWQFLNSPKLTQRIQPWNAADMDASQIDTGDYLLDWRAGGNGLRYAHHFSEQELRALATETGFRVTESYYSDGDGGRLGLYQIWEHYENQR